MLLKRHSGKHTLLPSSRTMCPRFPVIPWELFLWRALHCGKEIVKRDSGIKQELFFSVDPIHLADTQCPVRVTSPVSTWTGPEWKHLFVPLWGATATTDWRHYYSSLSAMLTFSWVISIKAWHKRQQIASLCFQDWVEISWIVDNGTCFLWMHLAGCYIMYIWGQAQFNFSFYWNCLSLLAGCDCN